MLREAFRFLNNLDARAVRAVAVSLGLFAAAALIVVMGKTTAFFDEDDAPLINWMHANAESPWALPATIAVFTVAGFLGAPQFALIAGAVVAFGAGRGAVNAWIATLIAASVMFWFGRLVGADTLRRYGGERVNRLSQFIGRNGFVASLTVRLVPLAPALIVNMAAGVTHMRYAYFAAGTGLGVVPKIALVAFAGQGLLAYLQSGDAVVALGLAAAAGLWLAVMLIARRRLRADDAALGAEQAGATTDAPEPAPESALKRAPEPAQEGAIPLRRGVGAPTPYAGPTPDAAHDASAVTPPARPRAVGADIDP